MSSNKKTLITIVVLTLTVVGLWSWGALRIKTIIESQMIESGISYEKVLVKGFPTNYKGVISSPLFEGGKTKISAESLEMKFILKSPLEAFSAKTLPDLASGVAFSFPKGLVMELEGEGSLEVPVFEMKFKINKGDTIKDMFINIDGANIRQFMPGLNKDIDVGLLFDVVNINIPIESNVSKADLYRNADFKLNKWEVKFGDFKLSTKGYLKAAESSSTEGEVYINISNYDFLISFLLDVEGMSLEKAELLRDTLGKMSVSEDKAIEIYMNLGDGSVDIGGRPAQELLQEVVADSPESVVIFEDIYSKMMLLWIIGLNGE